MIKYVFGVVCYGYTLSFVKIYKRMEKAVYILQLSAFSQKNFVVLVHPVRLGQNRDTQLRKYLNVAP